MTLRDGLHAAADLACAALDAHGIDEADVQTLSLSRNHGRDHVSVHATDGTQYAEEDLAPSRLKGGTWELVPPHDHIERAYWRGNIRHDDVWVCVFLAALVEAPAAVEATS